MKFYCKILFVLFLNSQITFGQKVNEWTNYLENESVLVEYQYRNCTTDPLPDYEAIYLRLTNKTDNRISVIWDSEIYRNGKCNTCSDEYHAVIELNPKEILEGGCGSNYNRNLRFFNDYLSDNLKNKSQTITEFKLANLQVVCSNCKEQ